MATITGGSGNDTLNGTANNDTMSGGDGNDSMLGGAGNDSMLGGNGADTLHGQDGNDTIDGGADRDSITGGAGNDSVRGGSGTDTIDGGDGDDTIDGGDNSDTIYGGSGNDSIRDTGGNLSDDTIYGGAGNDTIAGGVREDYLDGGDDSDTFIIEDNFGNDTIVGGEGGTDFDTIDLSALTGPVTITYTGDESGTITNGTHTITFSQIERIVGTDKNDSINASSTHSGLIGDAPGVVVDGRGGNDTIRGGRGGDTISGGTGNDSIVGDYGDDSLSGDAGSDTISGGTGNDTIAGGDGNDYIDGGEEADTLSGGTGDDTIYGGEGADSIDGGDGYDIIHGGSGNDTISGGGSYDDIYAGSGDDSVSGGVGNDWIWGEDGNDTILAGDGNDSAFGGEGNDSIDGGSGSDTLYGDGGNDSVQGGSGNDSVFGGTGDDTLDGGSGADWVRGEDGNDSLHGGDDNDTVIGDDGDDTLHGDGGNDILSGHVGDDAMYGGDGADSLYGGVGDDYYDGGAGDDRYYIDPDAGGGRDFQPGDTDTDVVRLHTGSGHDIASDFHGEDDYIYIGATPPGNIVATQTGPDTWVLTFAGNANDSLTLNFASGTAPDSEGDLRNQFLDDSEYTPPENGNPAVFAPACFTPKSRILTPQGLRQIGDLRSGDAVITADSGTQQVLEVLETTLTPAQLHAQVGLRPVVIEQGAFGDGLPRGKMLVSRQHAFVAQDGSALIRAAHLAEVAGLARIQSNRPNNVRYMHLLLARHELVQVEGVWTETYFANPDNRDDHIIGHHGTAVRLTHHTARCRPLLSRAAVRMLRGDLGAIGRLPAVTAWPETDPGLEPAFRAH